MWKKIKFAFKEVWHCARIGLVIGFVVGFISAKIRHIEPKEAFEFLVLSHIQLGTVLGALVGAAIKFVRLWKGRRVLSAKEKEAGESLYEIDNPKDAS